MTSNLLPLESEFILARPLRAGKQAVDGFDWPGFVCAPRAVGSDNRQIHAVASGNESGCIENNNASVGEVLSLLRARAAVAGCQRDRDDVAALSDGSSSQDGKRNRQTLTRERDVRRGIHALDRR